ncbi:NUDIX domain-containing protein [Microtetraspora sp. NBRC 16547]|uniref:NUDIX domain-containing protein n=1 Tax=Microtetraspora sp. NBRC 16547 TaxID=3030993 RepID=UPI0024A52F30|nr:NUDIX domain-containing protein [Microtetraspora sp. NBRC 16547]GLX03035.1 NUDIX hydrolase [Microtetraspora sp. NBRC 16547]
MSKTVHQRRPPASVAVAVDLVIFTVRDGRLQVLLIERGNTPYRGQAALPGGFVRDGETLDATARRELREETGVSADSLHLEQLRAYSEPDRDPRGRIITIAYLAIGPDLPMPQAGTDASAAHWTPVSPILDRQIALAFDHEEILRDGLERARSQLEHTTIATAFCREPFTIADLRQIYEAVWGVPLDPSNFRRKVLKTKGFVKPIGERRLPDIGRPAALFHRGLAEILTPPLMRSGTASISREEM